MTNRGSFLLLLLLLVLLTPLAAAAQTPRLVFELEGGPVWQSSNDVEIPNEGTATRFSLQDVVGSGFWPAGRVYLIWNVAERHGLHLLLAPLSVGEDGVFAGPVQATYTFNSYRLS